MQRKTSIRWHTSVRLRVKKSSLSVNPSDKEQSFPYGAELKDALYTIGGKAESKDGTITIPAQSAGFYHI